MPRTVKRVVIVTVEGLKAEAIQQLSLFNLKRLVERGATALNVTSRLAPARATRLATIMTGVSPERHGVTGERFNFARSFSRLETVPQCITAAGFQVSAFLGARQNDPYGRARFVGRELGFQETICKGANAAEIVSSALNTLCTQRRGLIAIQFPDLASIERDESRSSQYADVAAHVDRSIGILASLSGASSGDSLLVLMADEPAGRLASNGSAEQRNFSLVLSGKYVRPQTLVGVKLEDVPSTILCALGIAVPRGYEGRALNEAIPISAPLSTAMYAV